MAKVIVYIHPSRIEKVQILATTAEDERDSWRLYQSIRSHLKSLEGSLRKMGGSCEKRKLLPEKVPRPGHRTTPAEGGDIS